MAIYTTFILPEDRPNLRNAVAVYAVIDNTDGHIIAYCLNSRDAELLKALHVYYGANFTEVVNKLVAEAE